MAHFPFNFETTSAARGRIAEPLDIKAGDVFLEAAVPRFVSFVADLPRTKSGKIQKCKLREIGFALKSRDYDKQGHQSKRT
jgi:acyl-coenzyme A synthetase/AMP-(fatty) acid ligase